MFSVPVKMYIHRNHQNLEEDIPVDSFGSIFGGIVTFLLSIFMLAYLINLFINLYSMQYDRVNKLVGTNSFDLGNNLVELN